jgi:hypothetical protein
MRIDGYFNTNGEPAIQLDIGEVFVSGTLAGPLSVIFQIGIICSVHLIGCVVCVDMATQTSNLRTSLELV